MGKQRKGEKCPDTGGTRTRDLRSGGSSLNHQTTSAPLLHVEPFIVANSKSIALLQGCMLGVLGKQPSVELKMGVC